MSAETAHTGTTPTESRPVDHVQRIPRQPATDGLLDPKTADTAAGGLARSATGRRRWMNAQPGRTPAPHTAQDEEGLS